MTTYMGPSLAAMVPVECASSLASDGATRTDEATNMAGQRRIYIDSPDAPALRSWSLSLGARDPSAMATLHELESLRVPLRFISDSAAVNNILPPAATYGPIGWLPSAGVLAQGGPQSLQSPSRFTASSVEVMADPAVVFSPLFPVVPGLDVSASIHLLPNSSGEGTVELQWMAASANQGSAPLATADGKSTTQPGPGAPYLTVGATPPLGVVAARLRLTGVSRFARPAVTWTSDPQPFRPGEGAECVHLSPLSQNVHHAWSDGTSYSGYQYTVTEATP